MHGGSHGQHNVADVVRHADLMAGLHVGRQSRHRTLGGKGRDRRVENILKHLLYPCLSAGDVGVDGEKYHRVHGAHGIVDQQRPPVNSDQLRPELTHQVREVRPQADGSQLHDHIHDLHDHVI